LGQPKPVRGARKAVNETVVVPITAFGPPSSSVPKVLKAGVTGPRGGMKDIQAEKSAEILNSVRPSELHHGDCIGCDARFHLIASLLGIKTVIHPPDKKEYRAFCAGNETRPPAPYLLRDEQMVKEIDLLIATPDSFEEKVRGSGTWATVRKARKHGVPIIFIFPDGTVKTENGKRGEKEWAEWKLKMIKRLHDSPESKWGALK
jgi:hypothetical protein